MSALLISERRTHSSRTTATSSVRFGANCIASPTCPSICVDQNSIDFRGRTRPTASRLLRAFAGVTRAAVWLLIGLWLLLAIWAGWALWHMLH